MFYIQDDRPNSIKIDPSWLNYNKETSIALKYSKFTKLSTSERPCNDDPGYKFNECVDKSLAKR